MIHEYDAQERWEKKFTNAMDMSPHTMRDKYCVYDKVRILVERHGEEILCDEDIMRLIFDDKKVKYPPEEWSYFGKMIADGIPGWLIDKDQWDEECLDEIEDYMAENKLSRKKTMHVIAVIGNAIKLDGIENMPDFESCLKYVCR